MSCRQVISVPGVRAWNDGILPAAANHGFYHCTWRYDITHGVVPILHSFGGGLCLGGSRRCDILSPQGDLLLLEVKAVLLVDEHQVEVVFDRELVVHCLVGGGEVEAIEEETDGDGLPTHGRAIHDLELGDRLALVV